MARNKVPEIQVWKLRDRLRAQANVILTLEAKVEGQMVGRSAPRINGIAQTRILGGDTASSFPTTFTVVARRDALNGYKVTLRI
jgi:hypothetical protein